MEIELFALCDGAFNYGGKLTVVGTYDQLNVSMVPQQIKLSVAVKLNVSPGEASVGSKIRLSVKDPNGNPVSPIVTNSILQLPPNADIIHLAMALNMNLNITMEGMHRIDLILDETILRSKLFPVKMIREG